MRPSQHCPCLSEEYVLLNLEVLVLNTGLVDLDTFNCDDTLLGGEEPRVCGRVGEEEPT